MTTVPSGLPGLPLDQPVVCPVLIGRGPHLEAILHCVAEARTGRGRVILVSGEAGIGKSRLVAEVQAGVRQTGTRVLQGHCLEPDRTLPYAPLQDLLPSVPITQSPQAIIDTLATLHLAGFDNLFWMPALGGAGA